MSTIIANLSTDSAASAASTLEYEFSSENDLRFADLVDIPELQETTLSSPKQMLAPLREEAGWANEVSPSDEEKAPKICANVELFPSGAYSFTSSLSSDAGSLGGSEHNASRSGRVALPGLRRCASTEVSGRKPSTAAKNRSSRGRALKKDSRNGPVPQGRSVSPSPGLKTAASPSEGPTRPGAPVPLKRAASLRGRLAFKNSSVGPSRRSADDRKALQKEAALASLLDDDEVNFEQEEKGESPVELPFRAPKAGFRRCKSDGSERKRNRPESGQSGQRSLSFNSEEKNEIEQLPSSTSEHMPRVAGKGRQPSRRVLLQRAQSSARLHHSRLNRSLELQESPGSSNSSGSSASRHLKKGSSFRARRVKGRSPPKLPDSPERPPAGRTQPKGLVLKRKPSKARRQPTKTGREQKNRCDLVAAAEVHNQMLLGLTGGVPTSALSSISALAQMVADLQKEVFQLRQEVKDLKAGDAGGLLDQSSITPSRQSSRTSLMGSDDESESDASVGLAMCVTSPKAA